MITSYHLRLKTLVTLSLTLVSTISAQGFAQDIQQPNTAAKSNEKLGTLTITPQKAELKQKTESPFSPSHPEKKFMLGISSSSNTQVDAKGKVSKQAPVGIAINYEENSEPTQIGFFTLEPGIKSVSDGGSTNFELNLGKIKAADRDTLDFLKIGFKAKGDNEGNIQELGAVLGSDIIPGSGHATVKFYNDKKELAGHIAGSVQVARFLVGQNRATKDSQIKYLKFLPKAQLGGGIKLGQFGYLTAQGTLEGSDTDIDLQGELVLSQIAGSKGAVSYRIKKVFVPGDNGSSTDTFTHSITAGSSF